MGCQATQPSQAQDSTDRRAGHMGFGVQNETALVNQKQEKKKKKKDISEQFLHLFATPKKCFEV